jgi:hypothetical protein
MHGPVRRNMLVCPNGRLLSKCAKSALLLAGARSTSLHLLAVRTGGAFATGLTDLLAAALTEVKLPTVRHADGVVSGNVEFTMVDAAFLCAATRRILCRTLFANHKAPLNV